MKILGIDPGTIHCGYAVIESQKVVTSGVWKFSQKKDVYERIKLLGDKTQEIIKEYSPEALSLEKAFVGKNPQTALKLGEARGTILGIAFANNMIVRQYEAVVVKQCITGNHTSSKESVAYMVQQIFDKESFERDDESDALAIAYTFSIRYKTESLIPVNKGRKNSTRKCKSNWADYI